MTRGEGVARLRVLGRTVRGETTRDRRTAGELPRERADGRTTADGRTRWIAGAVRPLEREGLLVRRRGELRVGAGLIVLVRITGTRWCSFRIKGG